MTGAQVAFYLLPVSVPVSLIEVDVGSVPGRDDEVVVVCNPIRMGRWSDGKSLWSCVFDIRTR